MAGFTKELIVDALSKANDLWGPYEELDNIKHRYEESGSRTELSVIDLTFRLNVSNAIIRKWSKEKFDQLSQEQMITYISKMKELLECFLKSLEHSGPYSISKEFQEETTIYEYESVEQMKSFCTYNIQTIEKIIVGVGFTHIVSVDGVYCVSVTDIRGYILQTRSGIKNFFLEWLQRTTHTLAHRFEEDERLRRY